MILIWFGYDFHLWFFYGFKLWVWYFYGFGCDSKNHLCSFYGFEYVFVWGLDMICFMVFNDIFHVFFMVLWFLRQIPTKIVKKSQKNRTFLEFFAKKQFLGTLVAFTIFLRFFYDFGKVSLSQKLFSTTEIDFEADSYQNRKKIVNFSSFLLKMSFWELWWPLRFFYDFGRNLLQNQFLWWKKASGKGTPYQNRKKIENFSSFLLKKLWSFKINFCGGKKLLGLPKSYDFFKRFW